MSSEGRCKDRYNSVTKKKQKKGLASVFVRQRILILFFIFFSFPFHKLFSLEEIASGKRHPHNRAKGGKDKTPDVGLEDDLILNDA